MDNIIKIIVKIYEQQGLKITFLIAIIAAMGLAMYALREDKKQDKELWRMYHEACEKERKRISEKLENAQEEIKQLKDTRNDFVLEQIAFAKKINELTNPKK